jgi:outer membrane lipoprotein-sorting protein
MSIKPLALLVAAVLALGALPAAAQVSLAEIGAYFNAFRTAQAAFTQVNADGTISTGTLYIHRPGRVRFEYDPPADQLVMAGGGQVAVFDGKSSAGPEQYPLSRTPLSIILADPVDLSRERMVSAHTTDGTTTTVTARDPANPDSGTIRLVFTGDPVQLRQWVVTNGAGEETTVILGEMRTGGALPARLFNIVQEAQIWR